MTVNIRIGTYNIGQGWDDFCKVAESVNKSGLHDEVQKKLHENGYYEKKARYEGLAQDQLNNLEPLRELKRDLDNAITVARKDIFNEAESRTIQKLSQELDVICLQEVVGSQRQFIKQLNDLGFDYVVGPANRTTRLYSTAIAIRRGIFSRYVDISAACGDPNDRKIYGKQIAAIHGQVSGKEKTISIASLHNWGFQLFDPNVKNKRYSDRDIKAQKNHSEYLEYAVEHLAVHESHATILTGDLNNNPENYQAPFSRMRKMGFTLKRANAPTNLNPSDSYNVRELDFGFTKVRSESLLKSIALYVANIFAALNQERVEVTDAEIIPGFKFDIESTCSDHLPIRFTVRVISEEIPSKITQLFRKIVT